MTILGVFDQTSSKHKIRSRNVLRVIKSSFESLRSIFFEKKNLWFFYDFLCLFVTKTVICDFNNFWYSQFLLVPFWLQKGTKNRKKIIKNIFSKNMDRKLSKDVPTILRTFLDQILRFGELWLRSAKNAILAIFSDFWWNLIWLSRIVNFELRVVKTF